MSGLQSLKDSFKLRLIAAADDHLLPRFLDIFVGYKRETERKRVLLEKGREEAGPSHRMLLEPPKKKQKGGTARDPHTLNQLVRDHLCGKLADDTTIIGLIQDSGRESAYRGEMERLVQWCSWHNLELNPLKMWEADVTFLLMKAQQRMYFLCQLRRQGLSQQLLVKFYTPVIQSVLCRKPHCDGGADTLKERSVVREEGAPPSKAPLVEDCDRQPRAKRLYAWIPKESAPSCESLKSERSMGRYIGFRGGQEHQRRNREDRLDSTLQQLEETKKNPVGCMREEKLAGGLWSRSGAAACAGRLKRSLQKKFNTVSEGVAIAGNSAPLNQIYIELYITEGGTDQVNQEHEVWQIEAATRKQNRPGTTIRQEDLFKASPDTDRPIRSLLTKGVAGIGKTVLTQKLTLDWAEGKTHQNFQLVFLFSFRELNLLKRKKLSLVELVQLFFPETKEAGLSGFEGVQVLFILDGLDECRLPLDFNSRVLTEATVSTSVDVLLTNLIKGKLLPSAHLWITTRPAAANQIPPECVDMVTDVKGFTDQQKEEYFRKRFRDEDRTTIISHIKSSRSLFIMCHIPIFCWITATVLEDMLKSSETRDLPKTLTEMYIHFLVVQSKVKKLKYHGGAGTDRLWDPESVKMMRSLAKLAFEQLQRGNLIFYESDLAECGIDVTAASVYSGVFTQIFREERGLYQDKVFCFLHLTLQEFLAALHVHLKFFNSGVNLLRSQQTFGNKHDTTVFYQSATNEAVESPNGHLDLFLRFLLGFSLQTNQSLLPDLLTQTGSRSWTHQDTAELIKKNIKEKVSPERIINLFHCLSEVKDTSLLEEVQVQLRSGALYIRQPSHAQWSTLAFILLSSEKNLDVFDLKKYSASEEALERLLPVVQVSKEVLLRGCGLTERSGSLLSSVLSSPFSSLTRLDLSWNNLKDPGVELLSAGLKSPHCHLETLSLRLCRISERGCASLASALTSNPSHLRDLDLRDNHAGGPGLELLSAGLKSPGWRLETLSPSPTLLNNLVSSSS
ncbi:NLR family CARD domain-containing protein 3-like [Neosynchiropus ocellatus]